MHQALKNMVRTVGILYNHREKTYNPNSVIGNISDKVSYYYRPATKEKSAGKESRSSMESAGVHYQFRTREIKVQKSVPQAQAPAIKAKSKGNETVGYTQVVNKRTKNKVKL